MKTRHKLFSSLILSAIFISGAYAYEPGDIIVRAGLTSVSPHESSSTVEVDSVGDVGMGASVDTNAQLGLNAVYMITNRFGVEILAATPFSHNITLTNTEDNDLGLGDGKLAESSQLPPTLSAIYYLPVSETIQPYLGVGINYTVFFDEKFASNREAQSFSNLSLDESFGIAAQIGMDYKLDEHWLVNVSVRYIDIDTEAKFDVLDLPAQVSVDIDPWVYSIMIGYTF
ncbi:OmpW family outer membrane protein [Paraglaciecola sp. Hal342]|jgi:outer membrane protein|uniref:Outer membrane protein W n=1 Tax=Paraglaciecola chathamensis TaxID=368405 RepID=A0A8H9II43_9ALTE|nr:OmpW family outer membrane protein [Paraglaciecola oceanifecundans]GGZ70852.1 outer membrane protein W [Paraglaciecola oceanifecundans]